MTTTRMLHVGLASLLCVLLVAACGTAPGDKPAEPAAPRGSREVAGDGQPPATAAAPDPAAPATASAPGPATSPDTLQVYTSQDLAISFRYPASWQQVSPAPDGVDGIVQAVDGTGQAVVEVKLLRPQALNVKGGALRQLVDLMAHQTANGLRSKDGPAPTIQVLTTRGATRAELVQATQAAYLVLVTVLAIEGDQHSTSYLLQVVTTPEMRTQAEAVARSLAPTGRSAP